MIAAVLIAPRGQRLGKSSLPADPGHLRPSGYALSHPAAESFVSPAVRWSGRTARSAAPHRPRHECRATGQDESVPVVDGNLGSHVGAESQWHALCTVSRQLTCRVFPFLSSPLPDAVRGGLPGRAPHVPPSRLWRDPDPVHATGCARSHADQRRRDDVPPRAPPGPPSRDLASRRCCRRALPLAGDGLRDFGDHFRRALGGPSLSHAPALVGALFTR